MVASLFASLLAGMIPPPAMHSLADLTDSAPLSALAKTAAGLLPDASTAQAVANIVAENSNGPVEGAPPFAVALVAQAPVAHTANAPIPGANAGQIRGTVFQDYNSNGVMNTTADTSNPALDTGVAGVTVKAYDAVGAQVGATATTAADGTYMITGITDGATYRVEFSTLPTGYEPSFHGSGSGVTSGTSVQFVTGGSGNVSFGINRPCDYCEANPELASSQYYKGNKPTQIRDTIIGFPYTAGSSTAVGHDNPSTVLFGTSVDSVGTTWGLGYARSRQQVYAATFFKRHAQFGPGADGIQNNADDPSAVYVVDENTGNVVATYSVAGVTTNAHNVADYDSDNGNTGWDAVGKTALGGLDLSDDEQTLYVMDVQNRRLVALNAVTGAPITAVNVPTTGVPTPAIVGGVTPTNATCASGDVRPFAVEYYHDTLYFGMVCSAESTGNVNDLWAYIYTADPTTLAISAAPVFSTPLNYPRGAASDIADQAADWNPWTPTYHIAGSESAYPVYPQPMLTGLTFENDRLVLGLRDRFSDQVGNGNLSQQDSTNRPVGVAGGDILQVCQDNADQWMLESNGLCNGLGTSGNPGNSAGQGPGNGEFYYADDFSNPHNSANYHDEISSAGVVQVPGFPELAVTVFDPVPRQLLDNVFDGGIRWFNNRTGALERFYTVYEGDPGSAANQFGKSGGMGDLIALCDPAPLEIGNRVWDDLNGDGVQDPGEPGLPNLAVSLQGPTATVTINTDADGHYYFGGLATNTAYTLTMNVPADYRLTAPNTQALDDASVASNDAIRDTRDSDAALVGGVATIYYTTGAAGQNNHGLDFGFTQPTGGFTIRKEIVTTDGNEPAVSGTFQIVASCPGNSGYPASLTLNADGAEVAVGNLISGTVCTFREDMLTLPSAPGGYTWVNARISPASITVHGDVIATVTAINTLAPQSEQPTTVLTVTKTISGTGSGPFDITVTGPSGVISATTINGGETKLFTGLISGVYTVTESTPAGWTTVYTATASAGSATGGSTHAVVTLQNSNAATLASTPITGTVFRDFNSDGQLTANGVTTDTGVSAVTITTYDKTGAVVGSATSAADGTYTINPTGAGPYRVEFSNLPSGYAPTTHSLAAGSGGNGTSTQFVTTTAGASNVNLGVNHPADYCQNNPNLCTNLLINGDLNSTAPTNTLISFGYGYSNTTPLPSALASKLEVGSTWGLAYARTSGILYSAAFLKRHVGLGPDGLGAIYATNVKTAGTNLFADLAGQGASVGTVLSNSARNLGAPNAPSNDATVFDQIGKVGLGGITIADDEQTLYVTSLNDKQLYALNVAGGNILGRYAIPDPGCVGGAWRPFATKFWRGDVYVGGVCDAQISQSASDLHAYVMRFVPGANTFSAVVDFALNYTKGSAGSFSCATNAGWYPWINTLPASCRTFFDALFYVWPQPILANIEFDLDGSMILGFTDRMAQQTGFDNYPPTGNTLERGTNGGDILRVYNNNGAYVLENNGNAGSFTTVGAGNAEGPGGGEFYLGDNFGTDHREAGLGGLALLPGSGQVAANATDPFNYDQNGTYWFDNMTGAAPRKYQIYQSNSYDPSTFGKSSGLGDLELLCDAAPLEIGNRVWDDLNGDGVQDPGEPGLPNLAVSLQGPTGTVTINTDAAGHYYFGGLATHAAYTLTINVPADYTVTLANEDSVDGTSASSNDTIRDTRDSDAVLVGGVATIYYTTGAAGQNNHGLDFGFTHPVSGQVDILNIAPIVSLGNRVWYDTNNNGRVDGSEQNVADGVVVELYQDSDGSGGFSVGDTLVTQTVTSGGYYTFTNLVPSSSLATQYLVVISDSNFLAGGLLAGYVNSAGQYADPLAASGDNQDHGAPINALGQAGGVVASRAISLTATTQPTGEGNEGHDPIQTSDDSHSNQTIDFGFYQLVLGNRIWDDLNNNGLDDNEPALNSLLTVTATNQSTGDVYTTTTDSHGYYTFTGIISGTYVVSFDAPVGYMSSSRAGQPNAADQDDNGVGSSGSLISSAPFVLLPGESIAGVQMVSNSRGTTANPSVDFGIWQPLELGNRVWYDVDNSGTIDAAEVGVAGVTLSLLDGVGTPVLSTVTGLPFTTTTNSGGYYTFTGLISGTYQVRVDAGNFQAGQALATYLSSDPTESDPNANGDRNDNGLTPATPASYLTAGVVSGLVSLRAGDEPTAEVDESSTGTVDTSSNLSVDFGFFAPASLGDLVWYDANQDGIQDAIETGVAGVVVTLYAADGTPLATMTTDTHGYYRFDNLIPGGYYVEFQPPAGYLVSPLNTGTDDAFDSDADGTTLLRTPVTTLVSGEHNPTLDLGLWLPDLPALLGNRVWFDSDHNGVQDTGEADVPGVVVNLYDGEGQLVATTITDAKGEYRFPNLEPGAYAVEFILPPDYLFSPQNQGNDGTLNSDADLRTGRTEPVILQLGETNLNLDVGIYLSPTNLDEAEESGFRGYLFLPIINNR